MTSRHPREVSVVIPFYNRNATLERAVSSIRSQPGFELEIIVVDDASPDAADVSRLGGSIRVIRLPENAGPGVARNVGARDAQHGYVAFLDADDEWLPGSLQPRLAAASLGYCAVGDILWSRDRLGRMQLRAVPPEPPRWLPYENRISPSTLVLRKESFDRSGGFPERHACAEDWVFLLRVMRAGTQIAAVEQPVAIVHEDGANTTLNHRTLIDHALGALDVMTEEGLAEPEQLARARRVVNARVAGYSANAGHLRPAIHHAAIALGGVPDTRVARELLQVPIQGARGFARRRRTRLLEARRKPA